MGITATSGFSSVPHHFEPRPDATATGQHDAPAHDHSAHHNGAPSARGSSLPRDSDLAAQIAVQLKQNPLIKSLLREVMKDTAGAARDGHGHGPHGHHHSHEAHGNHKSHGPHGHSVREPLSQAYGSSQSQLMVNSNTNTVDTGRYTIQASKDDGGKLTVTDNITGESFKIWGDPHIETSDGDKTDFMQKPATFLLPDGTKVTVTPTKGDGATYIDNVTITRGNDAAQIGGVHDGNLQTVALRGEGRYLDNATPDGTVLRAKNGHIDDLMLANGTEIQGKNIKNIDQYAGPEMSTKPFPSPMRPPEGGRHWEPFPPIMSPSYGANRPNHMGPFSSDMPQSWGIAMLYMMGTYLAAMFQGFNAGASGAGGPSAAQPEASQPPMSPQPQQPQHSGPMMVNSNTNTVDTGRYTIQASKDNGGTLNVTDNITGESFKIWGDPHIETSDGDKTDFMHQPATFMLPDGTKITVTPTKGDGATYIDNVTITRGNDAAQIGGVHDGNLHTVALRGEGRYLDNATPDGTVLTAGNGHIDDLVLQDGTEIQGNNIKNIDQYAQG